MAKRGLALKVMALVALFITGCYSSHKEDINAFLRPRDPEALSNHTYVLQPPDEIEIQSSKVPELHLQRQQIRPDGIVSFEELGEFNAAGKTPSELAHTIKQKVYTLYSVPGQRPVDVRIVTYKSKVYYILGQVYFPGMKVLTGRDTVLKALSDARPSNLAWLDRVQVIRPSDDTNVKPKIFEVNFKKMQAHGDTTKNVMLEEGDVIYVPPTVLARIGLLVEELVSPIGRAFSTINIVQGPPARRD